MSRLLHAEIWGLTGRDQRLSITFDEGVNVLWGANGSGKTTVLKIIHSALTGDAASLVRLSFDSAKVTFELENGSVVERSLTADARTRLSPKELWRLSRFSDIDLAKLDILEESRSWHWDGLPDEGDAYLPHRYLPISRIFDFRNGRGRPSRTGSALNEVLDEVEYDRVFAEQIQSLWSEYHANALARTRIGQQNAVNRILGAVLGADEEDHPLTFVPESDAKRLVQEFFRGNRQLSRHVSVAKIMAEYKKNPLMSRVVSTITDVQRGIEASLEPERRFTNVLNHLYKGAKIVDTSGPRRLSVHLPAQEKTIPVEALASGEKQAMRILLETLVAASSPVIIDEPEISLHVDWQSDLLEQMRFINPFSQLVVATHSPEIVGGAPGKIVEI